MKTTKIKTADLMKNLEDNQKANADKIAAKEARAAFANENWLTIANLFVEKDGEYAKKVSKIQGDNFEKDFWKLLVKTTQEIFPEADWLTVGQICRKAKRNLL